MEQKVKLTIPSTEFLDPKILKFDGQNPNKMSDAQKKALWQSICRFGFIVPIITNKDLLVADGQQRAEVALENGATEVPVIRLPLIDVDRRLLRQVLNKLKGTHDFGLDAKEFDLLVKAGRKDDLRILLLMSDSKLERYEKFLANESERGIEFASTFQVVIICEDEKEQEEVFTKMKSEGYTCQVLTL